jgi:CCR4-NOT transcription complex subunit 2
MRTSLRPTPQRFLLTCRRSLSTACIAPETRIGTLAYLLHNAQADQQPVCCTIFSEFPSLSSSQSQHQNSSQAAWTNAPQRGTPVQRPQPNSGSNQASASQQQQQQDDLFPSVSQFTSGLDDFRASAFGGQARQMAGSSQPQTGNIDEFPPLGRTGNGEIGQDRRGSLMQNVGFGGHSNGAGFGPGLLQPQSLQTRSGLLSTISGQQEQTRQGGLPPAGLGSNGMFQSFEIDD